eukprot:753348-Hanusia_phi.AAC.1
MTQHTETREKKESSSSLLESFELELEIDNSAPYSIRVGLAGLRNPAGPAGNTVMQLDCLSVLGSAKAKARSRYGRLRIQMHLAPQAGTRHVLYRPKGFNAKDYAPPNTIRPGRYRVCRATIFSATIFSADFSICFPHCLW